MGVTSILRRLAFRSAPRVFCISGSRSRDEARLVHLAESIHFTIGPRAANILLIVGNLDEGLIAPAIVAHDALASPRATLWWSAAANSRSLPVDFPDAVVVDSDPEATLRSIHEDLVSGKRKGEGTLLPDVEPAEWRGVGPYGQGGKAMTGGAPYGRPLPERAEDRDGLKLDHLPLRVGPFFPAFPVGFALDVKLQGDVVQAVAVETFADAGIDGGSIFHRALREPVPIADLELARARNHLQWLSDAVAVAGTRSFSEKILRLAARLEPGDIEEVRRLEGALRRRGFLGWATRGIGVLHPSDIHEVGGPVARATGSAADARIEETSYRRLGFEPTTQQDGDAAARWVQRLREVAQSLFLADKAGDARVGGTGLVESPRGPLTESRAPSASLAALVAPLVRGMEWGDAVTTIVSLDLDMSEVRAGTLHDSMAT